MFINKLPADAVSQLPLRIDGDKGLCVTAFGGEATILSNTCYHSCVVVWSKLSIFTRYSAIKKATIKKWRESLKIQSSSKQEAISFDFTLSWKKKKQLRHTLSVNRVGITSQFGKIVFTLWYYAGPERRVIMVYVTSWVERFGRGSNLSHFVDNLCLYDRITGRFISFWIQTCPLHLVLSWLSRPEFKNSKKNNRLVNRQNSVMVYMCSPAAADRAESKKERWSSSSRERNDS